MTDPRGESIRGEMGRPGDRAALPGGAGAAGTEAGGVTGWEPTTTAESAASGQVDETRLAPWALFAAIVALATSMFVGWGIPVAVIAVIAAIMSLRRPIESRGVALWALVLGLFATLCSTGWLIWAATQFEMLG